ncbi:hypothetical protein [Bacillus sp. N35-10-4]|uniref:hypothetical protein n=1 Tax=Bacillus sp. N35-10-4 TaxID=1866315 RepID=UPI000A9AE2A7|nr:hypothetical protein [Bacillus sp. N35-10-4]
MGKMWEVEFTRSDGIKGKIRVKGEDEYIARINADNNLANWEPYPCMIEKITEVHK